MKLALLVVLLAGCVREAQSSSQGQQDGIVRSIFEVISTTNRYFVELGFDQAERLAPLLEANADATVHADLEGTPRVFEFGPA